MKQSNGLCGTEQRKQQPFLTTLIQSCSLNKDKTLEILNMLTGTIHGYTTLQLGNAFSAPDKVRFELAEAIDTLLVGIFQKYKEYI